MSDDPMKLEMELVDESPNNDIRFKVWDLFAKGVAKTHIAHAMNLSRPTVQKYIREASQEVLKDHMSSTAIEMLTEELAKLSEVESTIAKDLASLNKVKGQLFYREGEELKPFPASIVDAQKARLYKLKTDIIQQRIKMLQDCGAMPKTPEAMQKAMSDYQVSLEEDKHIEDVTRSNEEIQQSIESLIKHGIRMKDEE